MKCDRRQALGIAGSAALAASVHGTSPRATAAAETLRSPGDLQIREVRVTPIALPDPPILAAGGCHGPYFLRNIIEVVTEDGLVGIGETRGGQSRTDALLKAGQLVQGQSALAYRKFGGLLKPLGNDVYAGVELACLDAIGRATGRRLCELLGGPVRDSVEFASYLFYRYAADHPTILSDDRIVDQRGRGGDALDQWGDVRTPEAMAEMAWQFHKQWGFRVHKLKAGVFEPELELETLRLMNSRFGGTQSLRIDPNGRWTVKTAVAIAEHLHELPLEYYEDPVSGQVDMATVRQRTGLPMSTNMCVTRLDHIPRAIQTKPIDIVLGDHHGWGGITAVQTLGDMAEPLGWGLSQHSNNHAGITMAAMIHVGAVVPQMNYASDTHYIWLVEGADIIQGPNLAIKDGRMTIPAGPGVGVELDRDKLARAQEVYQKCSMRERDDAATMRRLIPDWKRTLY